ncbi:MAG TPA: hypothetical protein PLD84_16525 [Chitinophagales bacterium]|nr:hypothetical protein [Chitinophagales bacterium]
MSDDQKDLPPFFHTWKQFYVFVAGWLILLIVVFYLFTRYFS